MAKSKQSDEVVEAVETDATPTVGTVVEATGDDAADIEVEAAAKPKATRKTAARTRKTATAKQESATEDDTTDAQSESVTEPPISRKDRLRDAKQRNIAREAKRAANEAFYAGWSALDTAKRQTRILFGTVAGVEEVSLEGTAKGEIEGDVGVVLALIYEGKYKVIIPFEEIYKEHPVDMTGINLSNQKGREAYVRRQKQMAGKLLNVEIPFTITHMVANSNDFASDYLISGSRKDAIAILEKANYTPDKSGKVTIEEGSVVTSYITSVARYGLGINVGGVDTTIPLHEITFRFVESLSELYTAGDKLPVVVKKIDYNEDGSVRKLEVSCKDIELENAKLRHHLLPRGTNVTGIITSIRRSKRNDGQIIMTAYIPAYDMPATVSSIPPSKFGKYPESGDQVGLIVTGFGENGFVRTTCHRFVGSPNLLNR